ncbi:4-methyl-5(b-hydroxyethyl)-thiazole monophosphate biosynthesis [Anaerotaenia torta]|uniref:DJ-1 family glyoxalase III n=1 Tax=Anaerotaenia torta TaxID=433293 RepID=UPI003D2112CE
MAKVYLFLADGFEEIEGLTVVDLLRRAEIETVMVSVTGNIQVAGAHQITVTADALFEETDYSDAGLLVLPGGMPGTIHLLKHEGLDRLLRKAASEGTRLAAICAAPRVLGQKGLLRGRKATCYPGNEEFLEGAQIISSPVVCDGNITTSKGMGTAIDFSLSLIRTLKGEEEASRIAGSIQYPHYNGV